MDHAEQLREAARKGDLESLRSLLAIHPDIRDARNELGQSAILLAKYHRQQAAVDLLLSMDARLTLHEACAVGSAEVVQSTIRERGRLIDTHSVDGFTPLALACFFGQEEIARFLVDQGANINLAASNTLAVAPLHAATAGRHASVIRLLVENGADVNARQQQGFTPLHAAAQNGDLDTLRLLLAHGADRSLRSDNGQTALDLAMLQGHAAAAALLQPEA